MSALRWSIFPKAGRWEIAPAGEKPDSLKEFDNDGAGFASSGEARRALKATLAIFRTMPVIIEDAEPEDVF